MTVCSRCGNEKRLEDMCRDGVRDGVVRYRSYCKECRRSDYRAKRFGRDVPWKDRLTKIKTRANQKGIECTIEVEHLERAWDIQRGRCAYTQEPMLIGYGLRNHPQGVSVDRIDPELGYVPGNIVLCSQRANSIKQDMTLQEFRGWMPLWYLRLRRLMKRSKK